MREFETTGRLWLRGALDNAALALLEQAITINGPGTRLPLCANLRAVLGPDRPVAKALAPYLPSAFPTRIVTFDKTPAANWGVPWHQDKVIAVNAQMPTPDFTNWSQKGDMWHCEPPQAVLDGMLFLRLHLDDETDESGPMQIALGSHHAGIVPTSEAKAVANRFPLETCLGQRGDILVLKILTLHRSSSATKAVARRVLRVDYANRDLPKPLNWHTLLA